MQNFFASAYCVRMDGLDRLSAHTQGNGRHISSLCGIKAAQKEGLIGTGNDFATEGNVTIYHTTLCGHRSIWLKRFHRGHIWIFWDASNFMAMITESKSVYIFLDRLFHYIWHTRFFDSLFDIVFCI